MGKRRLEKKVVVIHWVGWGQRRKGEHSRFPATELGMRLRALGLRAVGEVWFHLQSVCCSGRSCPLVSRGCLLEFRSGTKQQVGRGRLGRDTLWDPQEMWAWRGKAVAGVLFQH